jgi:hypothetical protein
VSKQITAATLIETADVSEAPPRTRVERTFGLPTGLYVATVACYFGFLLVMSLALMEPRLMIPMAICVIFVAMFAGVNAKWVRMDPPNTAKALGWGRFQLDGIVTHTGRVTARDATAQVLILPVLILLWGIAVVVLRAILI